MKTRQPAAFLKALFVMLVLMPVPTLAGETIIKIDAGDVFDLWSMRSEIMSMMEDLGYDFQPIRDPQTDQPVQVVEESGEYRMLYGMIDKVSVLVEIHIRKRDTYTVLYFTEVGTSEPGAAAMALYRKLKARAELEFEAENVSDKPSFTMP